MMRFLLALVGATFALAVLAAEALPSPDEQSAARGARVFQRYCALCHGENADGRGRAAKHYTPAPANLVRSPYPDSYKALIIRKGGSAVGRSTFMPPWGDELSAEQIDDVVAYLRRIKAT